MYTAPRLTSLLFLAALTAPTSAALQSQFTFTDLGDLGAGGTIEPGAINNAGVAVGRAPFGSAARPFIWTMDQGMTILPGVNEFATATAINDSGVVVGQTGPTPSEAFRWSNGTLTRLGFLPGDNASTATDVLPDGTVVGNSGGNGGLSSVLNPDTFLAPGNVPSIAIPGARTEGANGAGFLTGSIGDRAFLFDGAQVNDLGIPGSFDQARGLDVDDSGVVVGLAFDPGGFAGSGEEQAYIWVGGVASQIPIPDSSAVAINAHGLVVGNSDQGPFLYDLTTGSLELLGNIASTPGSVELVEAVDINDRGQILGSYRQGFQSTRRACVLTPVSIGMPYCVATVNSTGQEASISATGSTALNSNQVILQADDVPNGAGIFFFGTSPAQVPLGNGNRCVGGSLTRLGPVVNVTANVGTLRFDPSANGVLAGQTRYFQFWYRDVAAGGAFFNLSNGTELTFTP